MIDLIGILFNVIIWGLIILNILAGILLGISEIIAGTNRERLVVVIRVAVAVLAAVFVYQWRESIMWCLAACGIVLVSGIFGYEDEERDEGYIRDYPGIDNDAIEEMNRRWKRTH